MPKYVLIADNNAAALAYIKAVVRSKGYEDLATDNGETAWELMTNTDCTPDLVIIELQLPGMSGLEFCRRAKRDEALANIPVIVMADASKSAGRDESFWMKGLGCADFMFKPFDPLALLARIQVQLRNTGNAQQQPRVQPTVASAPVVPAPVMPAPVAALQPFGQPRAPKPFDFANKSGVIPMEQRTINTPTERNMLKDASPDALVRLYLSAPSLKNFGIEFDILDPERIDGETRDSFIKRRTDEFAKAQSPIVLILSTETKESRNVAKVTCKRKEIIGMGEHPTVEEEYAFKKTYLGWKLIGVRKKAPKDADNSEF